MKNNIEMYKFFLAEQAEPFIERTDKIRGITGVQINLLNYNFDKKVIKFRVEQVENKNDIILTQFELTQRAKPIIKEFFAEHSSWKIHYVPLTFKPDFAEIDHKYITINMVKNGLHQSDLVKQLGIDKSTMSLLVNGERPLTRSKKALFYYYFKTFEMANEIKGDGL